jgi:hypothetical protein
VQWKQQNSCVTFMRAVSAKTKVRPFCTLQPKRQKKTTGGDFGPSLANECRVASETWLSVLALCSFLFWGSVAASNEISMPSA